MKRKLLSLGLVAAMTVSLAACGNKGGSVSADAANVPTIDKLNPEEYADLKADIRILTDRTDIVDTVYKGYADKFHEKYPNITVTAEWQQEQ